MWVPFEELPDEARVWIYPSNRPFTEEERAELDASLRQFLHQWTVHGEQLKAGHDLPYSRFVVLGLDQSEHSASGCSIDASVRFVQEVEQRFGVALLDRMNVTYKQGEYIAHKHLDEFRRMAAERAVSPKTVVFNNLVTTKGEYLENWEVPAAESWHARFF